MSFYWKIRKRLLMSSRQHLCHHPPVHGGPSADVWSAQLKSQVVRIIYLGRRGTLHVHLARNVTWLAVLPMFLASATLFSRKRQVSSKSGDESCIITSSVVL